MMRMGMDYRREVGGTIENIDALRLYLCICICIFVYVHICVFVYLCICVFVFVDEDGNGPHLVERSGSWDCKH